jgi:hypothetical protein
MMLVLMLVLVLVLRSSLKCCIALCANVMQAIHTIYTILAPRQ